MTLWTTLLSWSSEVIEQERQRAEQAESQLQQEKAIRTNLMDQLKALGIDLEKLDETKLV